ncbi:MAG: protease inhibitor I42 family protein [Anaerolineae bacterium]|nr:protease inhibitor I42 family protein [Anaerolineae bacterium]
MLAILATLLFSTNAVQARPNAQATATLVATTEPQEMDEAAAAAAYCEAQGGTVTTRYPTYKTNAPQDRWLRLAGSRDFCTFHSEADATGFQSQISIALDTLYADEPTLAVLAYLEPVALPPFTGANPSSLYCSKLGGTDLFGGAANAAGGGWVTEAPDSATNFQVVGMCVFADMSAIDSWGLTYKANGVVRGTDLSKVVRYQPTSLPNVFTGSSNKPSPSIVDQTLTEQDNGKPVSLKAGDTMTVQLASNPSTGYSWQVISDNAAVLEQVGEPQFDLGSKTPMPGAGGTETFTFRAVGAGTTTLTLLYSRPWERGTKPTPQNTWTADVTVE